MPTSENITISIILPSYNDARIIKAIESIIKFDDAECVEIVLIDGGSSPDIVKSISANLRRRDYFVSEKDKGIFDALNKGLEASNGEIIGWLGSDDFFSKNLKASYILEMMHQKDLFIMNAAHFRNGSISRITPSWPHKYGLIKFGFNNPHFSTFGKRMLLKSELFDINDPAADINYFLKIFQKKPIIATSNKIASYLCEGGFSSSSKKFILLNNLKLINIYVEHNKFFGFIAPFIKLLFKLLTSVPFIFFKKRKNIFK